METTNEIKSEDKVCYNCKYIAWLVGVGQGLKCCNPKKEIKLESIPSKNHTCDLFESKTNFNK
jgi:hypothetical protein